MGENSWEVALLKTACKGLSHLGNIIFGRIIRQNEYRDTLMKAQAQKDSEDIMAGKSRFDGKDFFPVIAMPDGLPPAKIPMLIGMEQETINLNNTLSIAANILSDTPDEQISDKYVSEDWFNRWRNEAKFIADADMRQIWGRILAEEVKSPGKLSFRTLDVIKNLSSEEAKLFAKTAKFILERTFLPHPLITSRRTDGLIGIKELQILVDAGLLTSTVLGASYKSDESEIESYANDFMIKIKNMDISEIKNLYAVVGGLPLTQAGKELLNIIDYDKPLEEELKILFDNLMSDKKYKNIELKLYLIEDGKVSQTPLFNGTL